MLVKWRVKKIEPQYSHFECQTHAVCYFLLLISWCLSQKRKRKCHCQSVDFGALCVSGNVVECLEATCCLFSLACKQREFRYHLRMLLSLHSKSMHFEYCFELKCINFSVCSCAGVKSRARRIVNEERI